METEEGDQMCNLFLAGSFTMHDFCRKIVLRDDAIDSMFETIQCKREIKILKMLCFLNLVYRILPII